MIDYSKFKYRIGDKVRKIGLEAEYEIVDIHSTSSWGHNHYKLKNTSTGCNDTPTWSPQHIVHNYYEPCSKAIKLLYNKEEPIFETRTYYNGAFTVPVADKYSVISNISYNSNAGVIPQNRAEEQSDDHSLDALRYLGHKALSKKVSR